MYKEGNWYLVGTVIYFCGKSLSVRINVMWKNVGLDEWYRLLHPRPVVVIVSGKDLDDYSCMAASWVMPVSRRPPIVAVAIARSRYTYEKIVESREFNLCILGVEHVDKVDYLGTVSGRDVRDKISASKLTKAKARKTSPPIIAESIAVVECKLRDIVEAGDHDLVLGDVLEAYVREGYSPGTIEEYPIPLHVGGDLYAKPCKIG